MILTIFLGGFLGLVLYVYGVLISRPSKLRSKLQKQGIRGPSPSFFLGNIPEMKKIKLQKQCAEAEVVLKEEGKGFPDHEWFGSVFPHIEQWRREYGSAFVYSMGNMQLLCITDIEMVKEISLCTSLSLGKPSYLSKDMKPLMGQGILASSGGIWAHQRKIIAPELYLDKVKGMMNLMVDSIALVMNRWETHIDCEGGIADIKIDDDLRTLSADIIARACFGSNYLKGEEIFMKLRNLQKVLSKANVGIPGLRYVPTKNNREMWKLEKEIDSMISGTVEQRIKTSQEKDLLQTILEAAKSYGGSSSEMSHENFIVDNCKNIYFAGYETTAITASWVLMLLAVHTDWQDRIRAEILKLCGSSIPSAGVLRSMKTLTMVIQETLRLYPPAQFVVREILQDVKFRDILIPKGVIIQIPIAMLQQNSELWGPDAHEFNPERFSSGISGACEAPQAYIPFGLGPRVCAGQTFAMTELKVILSLILSKYRFTLSPEYNHSPTFRLVVEPGEGVRLLMKKV